MLTTEVFINQIVNTFKKKQLERIVAKIAELIAQPKTKACGYLATCDIAEGYTAAMPIGIIDPELRGKYYAELMGRISQMYADLNNKEADNEPLLAGRIRGIPGAIRIKNMLFVFVGYDWEWNEAAALAYGAYIFAPTEVSSILGMDNRAHQLVKEYVALHQSSNQKLMLLADALYK